MLSKATALCEVFVERAHEAKSRTTRTQRTQKNARSAFLPASLISTYYEPKGLKRPRVPYHAGMEE